MQSQEQAQSGPCSSGQRCFAVAFLLLSVAYWKWICGCWAKHMWDSVYELYDKRIWKQEAIQNFPKPTAEQKIKPWIYSLKFVYARYFPNYELAKLDTTFKAVCMYTCVHGCTQREQINN